MGRDPHRAPGRLAPLRSDYEKGTARRLSRPPANPPPTPPERPVSYTPAPPGPNEDDNIIDGDYDYEPPRPIPSPDCQAEESEHTWAIDDTQPMMRVFAAAHERRDNSPPVQSEAPPEPPALRSAPPPAPAESDPYALSIKERHQLLINTIALYEAEWKLAGIRANPKNDRLLAYLIPRNGKLDLKETISRGQALVLSMDPYGNTEIKEPKKDGTLRKFANWLFGDE